MQMDLARQLEQLNREMDEQLLTDLQVQLVSCSNDVTLICRERIVPSDGQRRETALCIHRLWLSLFLLFRSDDHFQ